MSFHTKLTDLLKKEPRFVDDDGELVLAAVQDRAWKMDRDLVKLLLSDKEIKAKFFDEIEEHSHGEASHWIFNLNTFIDYILQKNFLDNSYTHFRNRIGLTIGDKYLRERGDVALVWPYKDTVLEGGQTQEEEKRKEIFFNEVLAQDEINRLLDPKALTNFARYTTQTVIASREAAMQSPLQQETASLPAVAGSDTQPACTDEGSVIASAETLKVFDQTVIASREAAKQSPAVTKHPVTDFRRDENGVIRENLIIKGNNLLALHTLKTQFRGQVKLIYIDPPYNPDSKSNTFAYNNNFNHSTWLTFMKNRLEVAKELMTKDGVLIVAIDDNEQFYLGVMLNELFSEYEIHCITIVHNPRGIQGTNFSYTHEYAFFVIPQGKKAIGNRKISQEDIDWSPLRNWGGESERKDAKNCFYPVIVENDEIVGFGDVAKDDEHPLAQTVLHGNKNYVYPIDKNIVERKWRYARQSVGEVKHLLRARKTKTGYEIEIGKDFGVYRTVWEDSRYDANIYGTQIVKSLVPDCAFDFPKSLWNVFDCLYAVVANDKEAIVLDFFAGSGTTAHAVLELNRDGGNRKFILCEQMHYAETVTKERVRKVIENNKSGDFIYCELMQYNQAFMERIQAAQSSQELLQIWREMAEGSFLNWYVNPAMPEEAVNDFIAIGNETLKVSETFRVSSGLEKQKRLLAELLDKNQLYVNLSEIDDAQFNVSEEDKALNKAFYG